MNQILAIATNTFRETVRDRVLYAFIFFALILTLVGIVLSTLSIGQSLRVLEDIGLFTISIIGGVIAIFLGTNLVYKEIDKKTIYLIFTKPIARYQFILGKFLGLALCILTMTALMGGFLIVVTLISSGQASATISSPWSQIQHPDSMAALPGMIGALGTIYLELLLVIALATFFSTFATPLMSVIFTLGLWICGHMGPSLLALSAMSQNAAIQPLFKAVYYALPDLAKLTEVRFELITPAQTGLGGASAYHFTAETILLLVSYVLAYIVLLLSFGTVVIERREFN